MKIVSNREYCLASTDVRGINNKEMRQMHELKNRIAEVLNSHLPNVKEKKYVNDDDLKLMHAILSVFTKEYSSTQTSAFDDELKAIDEKVKKMLETPETPQEEDDE
jgi:hypothetical protein